MGPWNSAHLLPPSWSNQTQRYRFNPGNSAISCLLRETNPYKAPRDAPRRVFASKSRKRALAAINEIFTRPVPFPISVRAPCSFPGRTEPPGEFAVRFSIPPCARLEFWCTGAREPRRPASLAAAPMGHGASPRRSGEPAGRPPAPPCWIWTVGFEIKGRETKIPLCLEFFLKSPWKFSQFASRSLAVSAESVSLF